MNAGVLRWFDQLAQQGIFTTDTALVVRSWNRWLESYTGHAAESVVGRPLMEVFPELATRGFEPYYRAALAGEIKVVAHGLHRYVIPVVEAQGKYVGQSGRIAPLEADGAIVGTLTVIEDVSERVASERELRNQIEASEHARGLAEEAVRVKDQFLTTLSHEIRTPLNAVVGWTKILLARPGDTALVNRALEIIDRNATAQVRLIDDMLDTARIMSGKLRLDSQPVDLARVALSAIDVVTPTAAAKGIEIRTNFEQEALSMMGDPDRLQQIIWNLLVNAIKFTDSGGRVTIGIARRDGHFILTVTDTGEGIDPGFLPQVFERFRQADPSASRRHGGLGIGLSLVRQLVELHGGRIVVHSVQGAGSTFTVTLPSRVDVPKSDGALERNDAAALANIRVLVVDDDGEERELLTLALQQHGAETTAVTSVEEVLTLLDSATPRDLPQVIVSDVGNAADGALRLIPALGQRRHSHGGKIPTIAVTDSDHPEQRKRVLAAGFQTHLSKPVSPQALATAVLSLARR